MAEGNFRNGSLLESEENNGGNTDVEEGHTDIGIENNRIEEVNPDLNDDPTGDTGPSESDDPTGNTGHRVLDDPTGEAGPRELDDPTGDTGLGESDDSTGDTGPRKSDDPTGGTGPRESDDPTGETRPRETDDVTGDTGLVESDGSSEDSPDGFCFVYLDKKTNTATIDEVNENTANGPDDEETQGEDDDGEISQPEEDSHDTDGFDGANNQRGKRNTGYRLGILILCLILTWFTLNQMDDQFITPSNSHRLQTATPIDIVEATNERLPNTNYVNPVEETQNQNMRAGLCFSGSQHDYQFCNAPSSTLPMNIPQLMIEEGRYTIQSLCPDDEQAVDQSNEQERGIQGLCPGGDSAEGGPINTCSLDNWLNMVYTQLDNCPCLLREVRRLADDGIPLFVNLVESHRLWKKGHISEAKWKLCGNHDMRSSEPQRILTLLESQLTHCFNTVNGSNGLVQLPHVILQGQRDNGSEWQDIAEAVSAYETRAEQVMVFPRPPVFLSLLLANLGSFQEDSHRISPNITFAGITWPLLRTLCLDLRQIFNIWCREFLCQIGNFQLMAYHREAGGFTATWERGGLFG
ncbi:Myosin light chain kinase, smooth muscle [Mizuhopecten yessoensis]|uniref:Myosin light chain kinase, smooth muscle n=1 Tax=Mizuhopecten yessoensis TaxID=6573 RepID=A0A210PZL7_MIZYE|nr:Myosin light chain kinase, smooth muscle [Mizuhopecten yessoensis]